MPQTIIYNPKDGAPIENFPWNMAKWNLQVNEMQKFPQETAEELLKRYGFLREVKPEKLPEVMQEMKSGNYKCEHCDYETFSKSKLRGHNMGKHKLTKEAKEALGNIKDARPQKVKGSPFKKRKMSIEEQEGIGGADEGWYGKGLEDDVPNTSMQISKPGQAGRF
jgi:hypothetical protein